MLRRTNEPDRVRRYSTDAQLRRIAEKTWANVRQYVGQPPDALSARIKELRGEWSIERYLQLNAAIVGLSTAVLAVTRDRRWGWATGAVLGFLLWHAVDGFDPPLPLLRQLGVRSRGEIDGELYALKVLRGDFQDVEAPQPGDELAQADAAAAAVGA